MTERARSLAFADLMGEVERMANDPLPVAHRAPRIAAHWAWLMQPLVMPEQFQEWVADMRNAYESSGLSSDHPAFSAYGRAELRRLWSRSGAHRASRRTRRR